MSDSLIFTGDYGPIDDSISISEEVESLFLDSLLCVNLEGCITSNLPRKDKKGAILRLDSKRILDDFKKQNVLFNLGNNHIYDFGSNGIVDTKSFLDDNDFKNFGAKTHNGTFGDFITIENIAGRRIAIVSVTIPERGGTCDSVKEKFGTLYPKYIDKILRDLDVDFKFLCIHGGCEFITLPSPGIRKLYRNFIIKGFDVVIGNHPHVPQPYESYGTGLIFYSLGNFVFNLKYHEKYEKTDSGYFVKFTFKKKLSFELIFIQKIDNIVRKINLPDERYLMDEDRYNKLWRFYSYKRIFPNLNSCTAKKNNNTQSNTYANSKAVSLIRRVLGKLKFIGSFLFNGYQKDIVVGALKYLFAKGWKSDKVKYQR
ncbi:MAG: CapA family protein [Spirochaetales bacterium]|nr:CapA family protein [Spirochaetales bacterium]